MSWNPLIGRNAFSNNQSEIESANYCCFSLARQSRPPEASQEELHSTAERTGKGEEYNELAFELLLKGSQWFNPDWTNGGNNEEMLCFQ